MDGDVPAAPSLVEALSKDRLLWALLLLLAILTAGRPNDIKVYPSLVDWSTIATLAGLLVLTKGVQLSGYLAHLGKHLINAMPTERALAVLFVSATALLSTFLTNDVALFVVVPLTLQLRTAASLPIARLVVFEAFAANAGSTLTPIGNPQNLFLWHHSHITFYRYVIAMLPLAAILMATLVVLTLGAFRNRRLALREDAGEPVRANLLLLSTLLYVPFLVCADLRHPVPALAAIMAIFWMLHRDVLGKVDWPLIIVFILMFIDLRLVAETAPVRSLIEHAGLTNIPNLYFSGIALSQVMSNVPAAILLSQYTKEWQLVAYAVNVGGFGFILGSLANIIALRMAQERGAWLTFHAFSVPFLLVAGGLIYLWLFM